MAKAEPPTVEELARKIEALERQVEALESELEAVRKGKGGGADTEESVRPETIVNIRKDGTIRIADHELTAEELEAKVRPILKKFPNQAVRIRADGQVKYQDVVKVADLCRRAGVWDLSFSTRSGDDS